MGKRWQEREFWMAIVGAVLVPIAKSAGLDDHTITVIGGILGSWILGRSYQKGKVG